jgi:predicted outer membrane repeat protein
MSRWGGVWALTGALVACDGGTDGKGSPDGSTAHTGDTDPTVLDDADGDGSPASEDCDDADPNVRPGIEERCDGLDTDCDPGTDDPVGVVGRSDGGNHPTIGEAVAAAGPGATVWICEGTYVESVTIDKDLVIQGLGQVVVDADGLGPGFDVVGATASISDLTITRGTGSTNGPAPENGGGVNAFLAAGPVTLTRVVVDSCLAELAGAVLLGEEGGTLTDCTFTRNVAGTHGGAVFVAASATIDGCTFEANSADGYGGAVALGEAAEATIASSTIEGNDASIGGGVFTFQRSFVDLTGSVVTGNAAPNGGGGLYAWDSEFVGGEVTGNDGGGQGGGVFVYEGGTLRNLLVEGNQAIDGAGLWLQGDVELSGVEVTGNVAADSAGGAYLLEAVVEATDTTVTGNEATVRAGGALLLDSTLTGGTIEQNAAPDGGGVYVSGAGSSTSHLDGVDIQDNTALYSGAGVFAASDFTLTDVDLSRNVSSDRGGGLYTTFGATGSVTRGTVFGNGAAERGGGAYANDGSSLLFTETRLTNNVALRGAGLYINDDSTVTLIDAGVEANVASITGGGARIILGTLISTSTDWGSGPLDNAPEDVFVEVGQAGYQGYGDDATFTCDEDSCVPLP